MTKDSVGDNVLGNTGPADIQQRQITINMGETSQVKEYNNYDDRWYNERETTENEDIMVCDGRSIAKEHNTDHYAEILTVQSCSGRKSPGRKTVQKSPGKNLRTKSPNRETRRKLSPRVTRNSDNPILCYASDSESQTKKISQDDSALYENTNTVSYGRDCVQSLRNGQHLLRPMHSSQSDSEIVYQNTSTDDFSENTSPIYENFEDNPRCLRTTDSIRSNASNETSETESLYEDLDDIYEAMSPPLRTRSVSKPIDIVYTSLDFPRKSTSPTSVRSCTYSTSSFGSLDRTRLRRCQSYCYGGGPFGLPCGEKPPELPQRGGGCFTKRPRPSSMHLGKQDVLTEFSNQDASLDNGLGVYTGTLVGSCTVMKTSPKSVQKTIGDILAREKREHSKPVSFDVSTDNLTLGLNCAPWNMLAENSVDDIGCVTTFSSNNKTALGYTISKPGEDTRLFVIHCSDADQIKEAIVNYFKRPVTTNLVSKHTMMSIS